MSKEHTILVGAHTSAAGGAYKALLEGADIGATTIQFFTSNQRTWSAKELIPEEILLWQEAKQTTNITVTMSHDSYLINLGASDSSILKKSKLAFSKEIERCHALDVTYLNFHPGAATGRSLEECLDEIVHSLLEVKTPVKQGKTRLLIETTAGQGTTVGAKFDEIAYLIKHTHVHLLIGVCIDTCHIFAAGYDIRTHRGWDQVLKEFDDTIGLKYLYAMHLNDSVHPLGSRKDRHALLGEGHIGWECFKTTMTHPDLKYLPKYLETPDPSHWKREIQTLKDFAKGAKHGHSS